MMGDEWRSHVAQDDGLLAEGDARRVPLELSDAAARRLLRGAKRAMGRRGGSQRDGKARRQSSEMGRRGGCHQRGHQGVISHQGVIRESLGSHQGGHQKVISHQGGHQGGHQGAVGDS